MTDKEITLALSLHAVGDISKCNDCPYFGDYTSCVDRLLRDAAEYVKKMTGKNNRLQRENKKLKSEKEHDERL